MEAFDFIREKIFELVEFSFDGEIRTEKYEGIRVSWDGKDVVLGYNTLPALARGLFLFAMNYKEEPFEIIQKANLDQLSVLLDVSRNGILTLESLKKYVTYMAALGYTHLTLYFEDVFELKDYPRHGYMRGRYTADEMKELNYYAHLFGIEIIPSAQSLGHMDQYLQWREADTIKDTAECLLVDEPKTYEFIEKRIQFMRECFPTAEIIALHLDETLDLGVGRFAKIHGYEERQEIFSRHANKVFELCDKYHFRPLIDSDMFFRNRQKNGDYYDPTILITEDIVKDYPENVVIKYWDYYHIHKEEYDTYIKQHKGFHRELLMAGAIRTWEGFVEDTVFTYQTGVPFIQSVIENGEKNFNVSLFGDGGAETNLMYSINSLAIFSEYCYRGLECKKEDIFAVSEFLTKMPYEHKFEMSRIHSDFHDSSKLSRKIFYADLFYNLVNVPYEYEKVMEDFKFAMNKAEEYMGQSKRNHDYYEYVYYFAKAVCEKCELLYLIRNAYENDDRTLLKQIVDVKMPEVINSFKIFHAIFKKDWLKYKKPNGLEVINLRIGGAIAQMEYQIDRLKDYLNNRVDKIDELEEKVIMDGFKVYWTRVSTPSTICGLE